MSDTGNVSRDQMIAWLTLEGFGAYQGGYAIGLYHPGKRIDAWYHEGEVRYYDNTQGPNQCPCRAISDMDTKELERCFERIWYEHR